MDHAATLRTTVEASEAGRRLDAFLTARRPEVSRSRFHRLIREGRVEVDGQARKPSHVLRGGETVTAVIPQATPSEVLPEPIGLDVLFEDTNLLAVNKPPGLVVHPAPGHGTGTLVNALLHHIEDLSGIGGVERPGIVHRLDKDTSGILVVAKNDLAHRELSRQFADREVSKTYLAVVCGVVKEDSGLVELPIGRHPVHRKRMQAAPGQARPAATRWRVRERFTGATLLEMDLLTGRTHQARVHATVLGHPVAGDPLYASRGARTRLPQDIGWPKRQMLHAWRLSLVHPTTGAPLVFEAPMPDDMSAFVEALRNAS